MEPTYFTPFKYKATINPISAKPYKIVYKGREMMIDSAEIEFASTTKLSKQEVLDLFDGTLGIEKIGGDFLEYSPIATVTIEEILGILYEMGLLSRDCKLTIKEEHLTAINNRINKL